MPLQVPAELTGNAIDERKYHGGLVLRRLLGGGALLLGNAVEEGARVSVGNKSGRDMLFLSGCALGFGDDA